MVNSDRIYKSGDEYRIVDNRNGHGFVLDDIVKVVNPTRVKSVTVPGEYYIQCRNTSGVGQSWSVLESDMEPVISVPKVFLDDSLFEI